MKDSDTSEPITNEVEEGIPYELIESVCDRYQELDEWENFSLWTIRYMNGDCEIIAARTKPSFNEHYECDNHGDIIPKMVEVGQPPFEADVRIDLVVSVKRLFLRRSRSKIILEDRRDGNQEED
jgi:hypothetical protein